jgi:acetyl-CoA C-acetyltransferase
LIASAERAGVINRYQQPERLGADRWAALIAARHRQAGPQLVVSAGTALTADMLDAQGVFLGGIIAPGLRLMQQSLAAGTAGLPLSPGQYAEWPRDTAEAIATGKADIVLVTLAGRPRSEGSSGTVPRNFGANAPDVPFELPYHAVTLNQYAMAAKRHMYEYGTTAEQLAWVKVAASHHAQHNPHAMLRDVVTVEEVVNSPMMSDPLHRLDCCVVSDGGGAVILARPEIARSLNKPVIKLLGAGSSIKALNGGDIDLTYTAGRYSGATAFAEAGVTPADIQVAEIYDCFTYAVIRQLEDMGFCAKGEGGPFVADGKLRLGGALPTNTHGGLLSQAHIWGLNHIVELVRQLRGHGGRAQVPGAELGLVTGYGDLGDGAIAIMRRE